jgi:site-specific DNA-methyltransferase (adenine-specific)
MSAIDDLFSQDLAAHSGCPAVTCSLFFGCCLDVMKGIESGSVDMVCADLPYGTTACKWDSVIPLDALWAEYKRVCKPDAAIVLTACQPFTAALVMSNPKMFRHEDVWKKSRPTGHLDANRRPMRAHESILVFSAAPRFQYNPQMRTGRPNHVSGRSRVKGTGTYGAAGAVVEQKTDVKYPISVVEFDSVSPTGRLHNTQKPVELMEYLIRTYSNEGQTVLDNSMGSGTTGLACANTGRRFIGIEKDADFFRVASERISSANAPVLAQPTQDSTNTKNEL